MSLEALIVLGAAWVAMSATMALAWLHQRRIRNAGVVDAYWSYGTGIACAACALHPFEAPDARQWLVAAMAGLWGLRLGTYISLRTVRAKAEDPRYQRFREDWGANFQHRLLWFLQIQPLVSTVLALAAMAAANATGPLGPLDAAGVLIWLVAVGGETLADRQMARFKADPANKGGVCDTGLWAWSRHPNYAFEWLAWCAFPVMALGGPLGPLALGAPVVMFLVLRYGSGVPPLEASMEASRGQAWRDYAARTPVFFPAPPRSARR